MSVRPPAPHPGPLDRPRGQRGRLGPERRWGLTAPCWLPSRRCREQRAARRPQRQSASPSSRLGARRAARRRRDRPRALVRAPDSRVNGQPLGDSSRGFARISRLSRAVPSAPSARRATSFRPRSTPAGRRAPRQLWSTRPRPRGGSSSTRARSDAAVVRADVERSRPLTALAARELIAAGIATGVDSPQARRGRHPPGAGRDRARRRPRVPLGPLRQALHASQSGQAMPVALVPRSGHDRRRRASRDHWGRPRPGASRFQRAADLAAVSAARSMRDDHFRLFLPATLPNGVPNPAHLSEAEYRSRATAAAAEAAEMNDAGDAAATVVISRGGLRADTGPGRISARAPAVDRAIRRTARSEVTAVAEAYPRSASTSAGSRTARPAVATRVRSRRARERGCGPTSPGLSTRWHRPRLPRAVMRLSSTRRSARTRSRRRSSPRTRIRAWSPGRAPRSIAAAPSSTWGRQAPTGGWRRTLSASASSSATRGRHGITATSAGPLRAPRPADRVAPGESGDGTSAEPGLPSFVPARFRAPIARASSRWNVPANVLAAQLLAESNFNPLAVSPAGASGIAQFMPANGRLVRARRPVRPDAGHRRAGAPDVRPPAAVRRRRLWRSRPTTPGRRRSPRARASPPIPRRSAYVARILGLMGGVGAIPPPTLEVRLVG